jgi:hypothetical protein
VQSMRAGAPSRAAFGSTSRATTWPSSRAWAPSSPSSSPKERRSCSTRSRSSR